MSPNWSYDKDRTSKGKSSYNPNRGKRWYPDYYNDLEYSGEEYGISEFDYSKLEREDIIGEEYNGMDYDYWDYPTIDYGAGEYTPDYDKEHGYPPSDVHQQNGWAEHKYAHERWARQRYGLGSGVPEYWTDRDGDYDDSLKAQYPPEGPEEYEPGYLGYHPDGYYVDSTDYYKQRYMPKQDSLKKMYMRIFKNIDYNIKVPILQLIATGALFFIFILNYMINIDYVIALGEFSPWVKIQPPAVAAILGAIFGIFLYLFPTLDRDIKRTVIIGTIILLIFFFAGPALVAGASTGSHTAVGQAFVVTIMEFLKLAAVLVYWAPIFLGIYGIWSRNSFYVGASAIFIFLIIIVLDIYLIYEKAPITKIESNWVQYVIFSIILFCYIEMSDSAITFANFTTIKDQEEIDPGYYDHLDRILQKYFVYFILFTIFLLILTWITLNFRGIIFAAGSTQVAESLELSSIYGIIISLIVISIIVLFIGLFIRNERGFRNLYNRLSKSKPEQKIIRPTFTGEVTQPASSAVHSGKDFYRY